MLYLPSFPFVAVYVFVAVSNWEFTVLNPDRQYNSMFGTYQSKGNYIKNGTKKNILYIHLLSVEMSKTE